VGIEEGKDLVRLIGPNPVIDFFELVNELGVQMDYTLYSSEGQKVKEGVLKMGYNKINFRFLKSQSYFLFSGDKSFKLISAK
jgi:hypothetical protein